MTYSDMIADLREKKAAVTIPSPGGDSIPFHFELWGRIVDVLEAAKEHRVHLDQVELVDALNNLLTTWRSLQGER